MSVVEKKFCLINWVQGNNKYDIFELDELIKSENESKFVLDNKYKIRVRNRLCGVILKKIGTQSECQKQLDFITTYEVNRVNNNKINKENQNNANKKRASDSDVIEPSKKKRILQSINTDNKSSIKESEEIVIENENENDEIIQIVNNNNKAKNKGSNSKPTKKKYDEVATESNYNDNSIPNKNESFKNVEIEKKSQVASNSSIKIKALSQIKPNENNEKKLANKTDCNINIKHAKPSNASKLPAKTYKNGRVVDENKIVDEDYIPDDDEEDQSSDSESESEGVNNEEEIDFEDDVEMLKNLVKTKEEAVKYFKRKYEEIKLDMSKLNDRHRLLEETIGTLDKKRWLQSAKCILKAFGTNNDLSEICLDNEDQSKFIVSREYPEIKISKQGKREVDDCFKAKKSDRQCFRTLVRACISDGNVFLKNNAVQFMSKYPDIYEACLDYMLRKIPDFEEKEARRALRELHAEANRFEREKALRAARGEIVDNIDEDAVGDNSDVNGSSD